MKRSLLLLVPMAILLAAACEDHAHEGEPCETTDECEEGLECDVHDGVGTCEEPHDD